MCDIQKEDETKLEVPGPIKEALAELGSIEWPYHRVFTVKPKKWWWRLWPKKRRMIRQLETWANSKKVVAEIEKQVTESVISGAWKMTELNYTLEDQNDKSRIPVNKIRKEMGRGK